jgi:putative nucleotidyltransferase-like protein
MAELQTRDQQNIHALSVLSLSPSQVDTVIPYLSGLNQAEREDFLKLADSHHVVLRALTPVQNATLSNGHSELSAWAAAAIENEQARISNALEFLNRICEELEAAGCPSTVMKSLDHWPDLGNDLDMYTNADERRLARVMINKFDAHIEPRSWGDRLAHKWNFAIPGLREAVEFHVKRLGQTGEHIRLAKRFLARRMPKQVNGYTFMVPAPEERIVVATLQRMYRHFYFRVCDMANSAALVESGTINYAELRHASEQAGIWPGVASYLMIVSDYVKKYRGQGLKLPQEVLSAARFGGDKVYVRARFIRVPIMPQGAELYTRQVTHAALQGDVEGTFRLNLLPPLALAAAVAYRLTGSDKGVW